MSKPWGPRQRGWGQPPSVPCPLAAPGRSRREDSPASVITSCPGWEKAPGGEKAAVSVPPGCPILPVGPGPRGGGVAGPWPGSLVPAPPAPCKQPGQPWPAAVLSHLGSALPF